MQINETLFPLTHEYLNSPWAYHSIDETVYSAASQLLMFMQQHEEFQKYNNADNSEQDVRLLFDEIIDSWIAENYLVADSDELFEKYNILTDSHINKALKSDLFNNVWQRR